MEVERNMKKAFKKYPQNGFIFDETFEENSFNFSIAVKLNESSQRQLYRFKIDNLPSKIFPQKAKLEVNKN